MIVSWSRTASAADAGDGAATDRRAADYAPAAAPERQPALAAFLPTGIGGLAGATAGILAIAALVTGPGLAEMAVGRPLFTDGGRFARTLAALRGCFDLTAPGSLAAWSSQILLLAAALVAWAVRGMRRHRRDDYNGRFRAWGWMAAMLVIGSLTAVVPLGACLAAFMVDATGVGFGPGGLGWWITVATFTLGAVSLWTVLPLHERLGTSLWLGASAILWAASLGCTWGAATGAASLRITLVGQAAWTFATATALVAMLAAARSVVREIRGEAAPAARRPKKQAPSRPAIEDAAEADDDREDGAAAEEPVVFLEASEPAEFTDGSEDDLPAGRKLTKAERKRLKRMARLQQAG